MDIQEPSWHLGPQGLGCSWGGGILHLMGSFWPWVHAATLAWRLMTIIVEILGPRGLLSLRFFFLIWDKQKG